MEMLMVICDRAMTNKVLAVLNESDITCHVTFYGKGTADSEILSYFGLAKSEKEVIVSFVDKGRSSLAMEKLSEKTSVKQQGVVALCVPLDAISKSTRDLISKIGG